MGTMDWLNQAKKWFNRAANHLNHESEGCVLYICISAGMWLEPSGSNHISALMHIYSILSRYIQVNEKILQIVTGNIGMVKKQRETRQGWIVHSG